MARKLTMTWVPSRKGWLAKYRGRMYSVSCRQLGVEPTKEASWRAARDWWAARKAEIDALPEPVVDPDPLHNALLAAWIVQEYEDKPLPRELGVAILGESRVEELERGVKALLARPKPERTIGANFEAWSRTLRAAVDAGRIDISRYDAYRRNFSVFMEWAGPGSDIETLNAAKLESFYQELARRIAALRYSAAYARSILGATKQFIGWLAELGMIPLPPNFRSGKHRFGRGGAGLTRADLFTPEEVRRLLASAGERMRLFLLLMLNAGMYQSDVSDLGEDEVDWEAGTIRRSRSKTGRQVVTYKLWPETWELLKRHRHRGRPVLNERGHPRVLLTGDGNPLAAYRAEGDKVRRYDSIQSLYARLKKEANVTKSLKMLRKTSASELAKHPHYKFYTQYFLAHAPRDVADDKYVIPSDEEFFQALDWLRKSYGLGAS